MLAISLCVIVLMILSGVIVWLFIDGAKPEPVPPQIIHVPTPVAMPSPTPAAPYVDMVRVRYLDAHGRVLGEQSLPKRNRRPQMVYEYRKKRRGIFLASHHESDGTWVYRFQSEDK